MKFKSLTNQKPVKNSKEEVVAMPPSNETVSSGSFKVTDKAAEKLKVTKGDYLDIAQDVESGKFFVGKGFEGVTTGEGDDAVTKGINGSKLGQSGSSLTLSAANAWDKLGDKTHKVHFELVGEPIEVEMDYGVRTYFELQEVARVERTPRKSSAKSPAESLAPAPDTTNEQVVQEQAQSQEQAQEQAQESQEEGDDFAEL